MSADMSNANGALLKPRATSRVNSSGAPPFTIDAVQ
jgi:hypothetical protein